jgi:hypothetical protein
MKWTNNAAHMRGIMSTHNNFVAKAKGKRTSEIPRSRWKDTIHRETVRRENVNWAHLVQNSVQWRALLNMKKKIFGVHKR